MMHDDDLQQYMHQISKAAFDRPTAGNVVFVMRQVLTRVWTDGFAAGHLAASRDEHMASQVAKLMNETKETTDG